MIPYYYCLVCAPLFICSCVLKCTHSKFISNSLLQMSLEDLFVDVTSLPNNPYGLFQLLFLLWVYGYAITFGAQMISDGSELLLLVPSLAGVVGSIILPILGAVPDGVMVLFSGLGPDAQNQLNVGVGTLAGSTIMLLTIPWFLSIFGGRVNLKDGIPLYKSQPKLTYESFFHSLTNSGVVVGKSVQTGAIIMIGTSLTYLVLQIPGFINSNRTPDQIAHSESYFALFGLVLSMALFIFYLYHSYKVSLEGGSSSHQSDMIDSKVQKRILDRSISIVGALCEGENSGILNHA